MTPRISDVAVCCCRASLNSRVSRATFVSSRAADELRGRPAFGAMRLLRAAAFRACALGDLSPALERRRIAVPGFRTSTPISLAWLKGSGDGPDLAISAAEHVPGIRHGAHSPATCSALRVQHRRSGARLGGSNGQLAGSAVGGSTRGPSQGSPREADRLPHFHLPIQHIAIDGVAADATARV